MHAEGIEHGFVRAVLARQRARVGDDHLLGAFRPADLESQDRHVSLVRLRERREELLRTTNGLEDERDHLRALEIECEGQVLVHRRHDLVAARHDQVERDAAIVEREGREHRPGMREERHRAGRHLVGCRETGRSEPGFGVDEAHPVAAAERHPVPPSDGGDPLRERRHPRLRWLLLEQRGERDGAPRAGRRRIPHRLLEPLVRERRGSRDPRARAPRRATGSSDGPALRRSPGSPGRSHRRSRPARARASSDARANPP